MPKRGENIYKRKDGRWEGRYIKSASNGTVKWGYVYAKSYKEVKLKLQEVYGSSCQSVKQDIEVKTQQQPADCFELVALEWLSCTQPQIKQSSYVKYRNMMMITMIADLIPKDNPMAFDNESIRKIISCIKVMSKDEILIVFKGGIEKRVTLR